MLSLMAKEMAKEEHLKQQQGKESSKVAERQRQQISSIGSKEADKKHRQQREHKTSSRGSKESSRDSKEAER